MYEQTSYFVKRSKIKMLKPAIWLGEKKFTQLRLVKYKCNTVKLKILSGLKKTEMLWNQMTSSVSACYDT